MPTHNGASEPSAKPERSSEQGANHSPPPLSDEKLSFLKKLDEIVDPDAIVEAGRRLGVIERKRKVDLPTLVKATIATLLPVPGAETSVFVNYLALGGETVVASSSYDRFSDEFAVRSVEAVRQVAPGDEQAGEWGVLLDRFKDIRIADSTCHLVKRLARGWAPSTSKKRSAGIKLHVVMSLSDGLPVSGEVTAQRVHDNRAFPKHTMEPGTLSLFETARRAAREHCLGGCLVPEPETGAREAQARAGHRPGERLIESTLGPRWDRDQQTAVPSAALASSVQCGSNAPPAPVDLRQQAQNLPCSHERASKRTSRRRGGRAGAVNIRRPREASASETRSPPGRLPLTDRAWVV